MSIKQNVKQTGSLVFGLDIGTRSIVGTVGYKADSQFIVVSQVVEEHTTRSMLDGQIHDIPKVSETIAKVKERLEKHLRKELKDVCIAAAGRVLQTITTRADLRLPEEKEITQEDIYNVESLGVEHAYEELSQINQSKDKFYCVGYSIMRYYLNDLPIANLLGHKTDTISAELIATFLPNDVVEGLYQAVEKAGLEVVNLTLEPIAAMHVAIPDKYRMLNIALVDVGAGTSDICLTKSGSVVAYGMIPCAGDSLTEVIAEHCLVDFSTAEMIKRGIAEKESITYNDIMLLPQTITKSDVHTLTASHIDSMTQQVAQKIIELNADKPVSAVFVIGGGGKYEGYTQLLARHLGIPEDRVALRGFEVMQDIVFIQKEIKKDSLLVTPVGICMSFYEHNNNFLYVSLNGKKVKLYDNGQLTMVDAIMQAGISNDDLFAKRGTSIHYHLDGKLKVERGEMGEAAVITCNGESADLHTQIKAGDAIILTPSTEGKAAELLIQKFQELQSNITVNVNERVVELPMFVMVNGALQTEYYEVQEHDQIELLTYYTVQQLLECMDLMEHCKKEIYVNHALSDMTAKVYDRFTVTITERFVDASSKKRDIEEESREELVEESKEQEVEETITTTEHNTSEVVKESENSKEGTQEDIESQLEQKQEHIELSTEGDVDLNQEVPEKYEPAIGVKNSILAKEESKAVNEELEVIEILVMVNGTPTRLNGKSEYVFVDVFEAYHFDLTQPNGKEIITNLNGVKAKYLEVLKDGDVIELGWQDL
ncbi:MAG: cell division FtsA domain-containing protein [Eubacteriales bacterium]